MKTVKEILEAYNDNYLSKADPRFGAKFPPEKDIPNVLNLRRKAIRIFPDGQKIALYYSPQLDKYVSIPYGPGTQASGIQVNETKDYESDVPDEFKDIYDEKKRKVSRKDVIGKMSSSQLGHFVKTGHVKGREAAGEVLKRYKKGSGLHTFGQLIGVGIQKIRNRGVKPAPPPPPKSFFPEELFKSKLKQIREARQYGKADAALDAASFIPGPAGSAASLASAGMSLSRGDYVGAGLDVLGALPGVGYLAKAAKVAKGVSKAGKTAKVVKKGSKLEKAASGFTGYQIGSSLSDDDGASKSYSSSTRSYGSSSAPAGDRVVGRTYRINEEQLRKEEAELIEELLSALPKQIREEFEQQLISENYTEVGEALNSLILMYEKNIIDMIKNVPKRLRYAYRKSKDWLKKKFAGKGGTAAAGAGGAAAGAYLSGGGGDDNESAYEKAKKAVPKPDRESQFSKPGSYLEKNIIGGGQGSGQEYLQRQKEFGIGYKTTATRNESTNFDKLKVITENHIKTDYLNFGDNSVKINNSIAKKLMRIYESLNNENKEKVEQIINEDISSFKKLINFAIRQ